jgi:outer membrane protein OmpA-like peptidoglycan-associated protein
MKAWWLLGLLWPVVPARAVADDLDIQTKTKTLAGHGEPSLTLIANAPIQLIKVDLVGGDKPLHLSFGPMKAGSKKVVTLQPGAKAAHLTGTLHIEYAPSEHKESADAPLDFWAEVVAPPHLTVKPEDVDLKSRTIKFTFTRPAQTAEMKLTREDGSDAGTTTTELDGVLPGNPLTVTWPDPGGTLLELKLTVTDSDGFYGGVELYPWQVDVPHEEVTFASGSSALDAQEAPKLDKSLVELKAMVKKTGGFAKLQLYVVGHTDTVGTDEANQQLSEARARCIAAYFRSHGMSSPIWVEGMGERALAVSTPDETSEVKNRRVEYILSVTDPTVDHARTPPHWKRL